MKFEENKIILKALKDEIWAVPARKPKIEKLEKNERKNVFADEKTLLPALFALKPRACTVKNLHS